MYISCFVSLKDNGSKTRFQPYTNPRESTSKKSWNQKAKINLDKINA